MTSIEGGYVNSDLYHLLSDVFARSYMGTSFSIEPEVFSRLVINRQPEVMNVTGSSIDIGVSEDCSTFCEWIEKGKLSGN